MVKHVSKQKVVAIIQARMGSARLPGKTMMDICGKSLLWHIIERIKHSRLIDEFVIATTERQEDDVIVESAKELDIRSFRGSENDVLDRFYQCARAVSANIIVRITADDPFKDPKIIDKVMNAMLEDNYDYVSNTIKPTYPEGLDVEVFSFLALEKAWKEAMKSLDREHVTSYIWNHPHIFQLKNVEGDVDLSYMRWTLDTIQDLEFSREIYRRLYNPGKLFLMSDILVLLEQEPELMKINEGIERFAGYKEAL